MACDADRWESEILWQAVQFMVKEYGFGKDETLEHVERVTEKVRADL